MTGSTNGAETMQPEMASSTGALTLIPPLTLSTSDEFHTLLDATVVAELPDTVKESMTPPPGSTSVLSSSLSEKPSLLSDDADQTAQPNIPPTPEASPKPQVQLVFLLISSRRKAMSFDADITIGRVKELVWNSWPAEWQDEYPSSPSHLRMLYLGRMLQDEDMLSGLKFPESVTTTTLPTIVHISIRPNGSALAEDADTVKKWQSGMAAESSNNRSLARTNRNRPSSNDAHQSCCCIVC